jgi:DNA-binding PadR family transcriptional regulator
MARNHDLPSPTEFQLLLATITERSGREVAQAYHRAVGREISYGSMYSCLRQLAADGWVEVRDGEDQDGRIKYFKIKGPGLNALNRAQRFYSLQGIELPEAAK